MPHVCINQLCLSHFRSHNFLSFDDAGFAMVLYGANGAGKTNILEAISMLSPGRGIRQSSAADMAQKPASLGWKISATVQAYGQIHEIETWSENGNARQVRIDGKAASQIALGRIAPMLWLVPSMDRLWIEGAEGRRRFLDRMTLSLAPEHANNVIAYEKAMRQRNRLLKDGVEDSHWYQAIEAQMAQSGVKIRHARENTLIFLAQAQQQNKTTFPTVGLQLINNGAPFVPQQEEYIVALAQGRARDMLAGRSLIGVHRDDITGTYAAKEMNAKDCSTGEQKALLISLILANARALRQQKDVAPILLLDEVAAHLDVSRRADLYAELESLGAQTWMSGTDAEFFALIGDNAHFIEVGEHMQQRQKT